MNGRPPVAVLVCSVLLASSGIHAAPAAAPSGPATTLRPPRASVARLPVSFAPNVGQFDPATRFVGFVPGLTVGVQAGTVTYDFRRPRPRSPGARPSAPPVYEALRVRATFPGANPAARVVGVDEQQHRSHYYLGDDPARWRESVPNYSRVRIESLHPGVDLEYHGNGRDLEYDFRVAPGGDARRIRVRYDGVERLAVNARGELEVTTRFGRGVEAAPVAWEEKDGARRALRARYRLLDPRTFGFAIEGRRDPQATLVIDPVLKYSTYLGGLSYDEPHDVDHDVAGSAYVAGGTLSPDFPAAGTPVPSADYVVFVTKLAPNGSSLLYSVFVGGSLNQIAYGIRVDAAKNAYIAGTTNGTDFPTTPGAFDVTSNVANVGDSDLFLVKLSPTGTLLYGSYYGGTSTETGGRVALDGANRMIVCFDTGSGDLPVTAGAYDLSINGSTDMGIAKLNLAGGGASDLLYATYLGGSAHDEVYDVEVDPADRIYVCGSTLSSNFPATGGPPWNGTFDAVFAKINPAGGGASDLVYGRKLGDTGQDYGGGIAVDGLGSPWVCGTTASPGFPVVGGWQNVYGGGPFDAWFGRFTPDGLSAYFVTFIGGSGTDRGVEVGLDPSWNGIVIGSTDSGDYPTTTGAFDVTHNGLADVFFASFQGFGTILESSYFGGGSSDYPYGFATDAGNAWYLTGTTQSSDFPTTASASDTSINGGPIDAFVTKFAPPGAPACEPCVAAPDTCCDRRPEIFEMPAMSPHVLVGTREPIATSPQAVAIYDLGSPPPSPLEDNDWALMNRWYGPGNSWNLDSLGTVFGLTLDKYGNIFVTHASCYGTDALGQVFGGGAGAVYRIDGGTGAITTFCKLPNVADPNWTPPDNRPALGNITYDCRHDQFFVTNLEDGRIYRIKATGVNGPTGTVQETFDPLAPDNGSPGWAPLGERLWGVQKHGDRVFYAVWAEDFGNISATAANEIRSVALNASGAFVGSSDQHELDVPPLHSGFSNPVSDISFSAAGRMLLAERGMVNETQTYAHAARVLEFACEGGCWTATNLFAVGSFSPENAAGGVDYDRHPYAGGAIGRVWASGDALHLGFPYTDVIYGYQGFRPGGGSILNSVLVDWDGNTVAGDKNYIGDVEKPGCVNLALGSVCAAKFHDVDKDGVRDSGEPGLPGWTIILNGPGGPYAGITDSQGRVCFYDVPAGNYTMQEANQPGWIQTAPAGGSYTFTISGGEIAGGKDFGNYPATGGTATCVSPPPGMVGWWPFREPVGSATSADVTHQSPPLNVLQLQGGAAIVSAGRVGHGICFPGELDLARVPNANQIALNFGAGPFAMDVWVRPQTGGSGTPRMIAEKRVLISASPYKTRGWALYLNGNQCWFELGVGISTQVVPGPTLASGVWSHVAVSIGRSPAQGRWYLNGAPQPTFDFVPVPGTTQSNADLVLGQTSAPFGFGPGLQGCLDELEIFNTTLDAASVLAIYNAGAAGKCLEYCRVPQVATICRNATSVTVCLNICNNQPTAQTYQWSLAGLPPGACTNPGPVTFNPSMGTVTVPANSCAPICVTIPRPAGLTAQNATSCYSFTFVNTATGNAQTCQGTIRADNTCWCVTASTSVVTVSARLAVPVGIGIVKPCGGSGAIPYSVTARYRPGEHPDPLAVSLDGLPPGEPVSGTLVLDEGVPGEISATVSLPKGYEPALLYDIVFEADTDGDGVFEPVASVPITAALGDPPPAEVPGERVTDSVQLVTSPNPFLGGSVIAFSLATPTAVDLGVFDVSGRLVRRLSHGRLAAGPHRIEWDGRDGAGRRAPAGIYFVRLESERLRLDAKLVKLK